MRAAPQTCVGITPDIVGLDVISIMSLHIIDVASPNCCLAQSHQIATACATRWCQGTIG